MDISALIPQDTFTFNLVHPVDGSVLDTTITVFGSDSKKYKAAVHRMQNDRLSNRGKKVTAEMISNNALELLVLCTEAWENMVYKGKKLECTPDNVRMVYKEVPWIYEQVDNKIGDRANFL